MTGAGSRVCCSNSVFHQRPSLGMSNEGNSNGRLDAGVGINRILRIFGEKRLYGQGLSLFLFHLVVLCQGITVCLFFSVLLIQL